MPDTRHPWLVEDYADMSESVPPVDAANKRWQAEAVLLMAELRAARSRIAELEAIVAREAERLAKRCCCEFEEDGETIVSRCSFHAAERARIEGIEEFMAAAETWSRATAIEEACAKAVQEEREACAEEADKRTARRGLYCGVTAKNIAAAIRARGLCERPPQPPKEPVP